MSNEIKYNKLTFEEKRVIEDKGTEMPFTGKYNNFYADGTYTCKKCGEELFTSDTKFSSACGWPSFDEAIPGKVKELMDKDGRRTEIVCANCGGHLGHVFRGEGFTDKNTRHCVNSISLNFLAESENTEAVAYYAGGCFWGVEYLLQKKDGVISTDVGFMGGNIANPGYYEVVRGETGHIETTKVVYNPQKISYEELTKYFFEIHDPTQLDRQGPDVGQQYKSVIFYNNKQEQEIAKELIDILKNKGYDVVTELRQTEEFYNAENYHQDYYQKKKTLPYCHSYQKRF
jgi:peptide methionine sulfoxide reductase msrA/msrB